MFSIFAPNNNQQLIIFNYTATVIFFLLYFPAPKDISSCNVEHPSNNPILFWVNSAWTPAQILPYLKPILAMLCQQHIDASA